MYLHSFEVKAPVYGQIKRVYAQDQDLNAVTWASFTSQHVISEMYIIENKVKHAL